MKSVFFLSVFLIIIIVLATNLQKTTSVFQVSTNTNDVSLYPYNSPVIPSKRSYITVLVGDSMTELLGVNAPRLRENLIKYYPSHEFVNYNYGFGATNISTLMDRLKNNSSYLNTTYPSILSQDFDLIIMESFAYNPLSEYPLEIGLKKQVEILDEAVKTIIRAKPNAIIVFMTPIAPDKNNYARGTYDLTQEMRTKWVNERIFYIKNHSKFAKERGIKVIDIYEKSLDKDGSVNSAYVAKDFIHPSSAGVDLITSTVAEFIFTNKIFPQ